MRSLDKTIVTIAYMYLVIPIALFFFGWLKLNYALLCIGILFYSSVLSLQQYDNFSIVHLNRKIIFSVFVILWLGFAWVLFSGIGGFTTQMVSDYATRNAILHDLIDYHWPVIYNYPSEPPIHRFAGHQGALVYYLAFWMPSAIIGKWFGWEAANLFLFIYSVCGIWICFYLLLRYLKKHSVWIVLVFMFWSGLDIIGWVFLRSKPLRPFPAHIEWWTDLIQYPAHTSQLFWVFNQAIPAWIVTLLILNQSNTKSIVFLLLLLLPFGPFPFLGLIPFIVYYVLFGKKDSRTNSEFTPVRAHIPILKVFGPNLRQALTVQNVAGSFFIFVVFVLYYTSNSDNLGQPVMLWTTGRPVKTLICYLSFCFLEFGIFAMLIAERFRKESLFILSVLSLIAIPWVIAGGPNCFCMRVSAPALLILNIYVIRFLVSSDKKMGSVIAKGLLVCFLLIGAVTPAVEWKRNIHNRTFFNEGAKLWDNFRSLSNIKYAHMGCYYQYVALDPIKSLFFSTLSKMEE